MVVSGAPFRQYRTPIDGLVQRLVQHAMLNARGLVFAVAIVFVGCASASSASSSGAAESDAGARSDEAAGDASLSPRDGAAVDSSKPRADPARACDALPVATTKCKQGAENTGGAVVPPDGTYDRIGIGNAPPAAGTTCDQTLRFDRGTFAKVSVGVYVATSGGALIVDEAKNTMTFQPYCTTDAFGGQPAFTRNYSYDAKSHRLFLFETNNPFGGTWAYEKRAD